MRPTVVDGQLLMHHGDVIVHKPFADAIASVVQWAAKNQSELVVLYVTDCNGDGCEGAYG